ncbi:hypothetical protein K9U41_05065 [Xanthobacter autotrophicus]|nr:hypothetical protein [Xanthobacter autotrophicus]
MRVCRGILCHNTRPRPTMPPSASARRSRRRSRARSALRLAGTAAGAATVSAEGWVMTVGLSRL